MGTGDLKSSAAAYFQRKATEYNTTHYLVRKKGGMWNRHYAALDMLAASHLESGSRVLDVGCGPGQLAFDLCRRGYRVTGLDIAPAMIELCQQQACELQISGADFRVGDVERTALDSGSFDAVVALGVIEYMESDAPMLQEMARILKPGGMLILNVTNVYGYTTALTPIFEQVKRIPGLMPIASWLRRLATGTDQPAGRLQFSPRRHRPSVFRRSLAEHGFAVVSDRYFTFSLWPAPFSVLTSRITHGLDEKLGMLDRTPLRGMGACYLVQAQKVGAAAGGVSG